MSPQHRPPRTSFAVPRSHSGSEALRRFAEEYGWWRVVAIPLLAVLTVWLLVDIARSDDIIPTGTSAAATSAAEAGDVGEGTPDDGAGDQLAHEVTGPDPNNTNGGESSDSAAAAKELPAGGAYTEKGDGTYRAVGMPGQEVGKGTEKTVRYAIEIENGVDTSAYGGDDAFAKVVDATLADPRGWIEDERYKFVHVSSEDNPDTTFQLTSVGTTAELCGSQIDMETSCHTGITGKSTVIINESRWVRGAHPFEGDVGNYRQYLVNHEFGHAIGYSEHQPCTHNGGLAPVMMQQTLSLSNRELKQLSPDEVYPDNSDVCEPNPWPYPNPLTTDVATPKQAR